MHTPPAYTPNLYGSSHGYGNVVFPGTGHAPNAFVPYGVSDLGFGMRLSNTVGGFGLSGTYYGGYGYSGYGGRRRGGGAVVVPYAVPYYIPYPEPQPPVTIVTPPPQIIYVVPGEPSRNVTTTAPEPRRDSVITYVVPPREYGTTGAAALAQRLYLIAFRNQSIYTATEYWLEDGTLHYITPHGAHNQASLDQVDLEFTERLNRERGLEFRLEK